MIFVINREWSPEADAKATYDATRMYWRVGANTRERAVYALGVAGGVVRGAYRIQTWHSGDEEGRWGFDGVPAPELGAVGTSVERLAPPRGAANPVRRYLDGIPTSDEKPVQAIARELNVEPLARIMYGQRELFHSNFLAWFFDALPKLADAVFRDLTTDGVTSFSTVRRVERERENLDLVLHWPDAAPLVIENKVFSLPERAQLEEYRGKTGRWKGEQSNFWGAVQERVRPGAGFVGCLVGRPLVEGVDGHSDDLAGDDGNSRRGLVEAGCVGDSCQ